jgi:putative transferase (TIGR04331 family)
MKRHLVTTAIEATWESDLPIVFLGSWCTTDSRHHQWSRLAYEVAPYHWDDIEALAEDEAYTNRIYEELLVESAAVLNKYHGLRWPIRAWRLVLGPWLRRYVTVLYDRYRSIQTALSLFDIASVACATYQPGSLTARDFSEFSAFYKTDIWNYRLYSELIRKTSSESGGIDERAVRVESGQSDVERSPSPADSELRNRKRRSWLNANTWKQFLKRLYGSRFCSWCLRTLISCNRYCLYPSGVLRNIDLLKLSIRLKDVPVIMIDRTARSDREYEKDARTGVCLTSKRSSGFESVARRMFSELLPITYLEGFAELQRLAGQAVFPRSPKVIFATVGIYYDEVFKVWVAEQIQRGVKLVVGQHGGHYATFRITSEFLLHELSVSDCYFSWGWTRSDKNVKGLPVLTLMNGPRGAWNPNGRILVVTRPLFRYCHVLTTGSLPGRNNSRYRRDVEELIVGLSESTAKQVLVRLHPGEAGVGEKGISLGSRLRQRFGHIEIAPEDTTLKSLFLDSRLNVFTYDGTPFLESMCLDCPCVLISRPDTEPFSELAAPFYDRLEAVGIFHTSANSAARHINLTASAVGEWWFSHEVVEARRAYCDVFARRSDSNLGDLAEALQDVLEASPSLAARVDRLS